MSKHFNSVLVLLMLTTACSENNDIINDQLKSYEFIEVEPKTDYFQKVSQHETIIFNNKMWVIGGTSETGAVNNIWYSDDGEHWEKQATIGETFSKRYSHQTIVFNNQLYVIGGYSGIPGDRKNDIWSSYDGITWSQITTSAELFSGRYFHQVVFFNNKLFLIE